MRGRSGRRDASWDSWSADGRDNEYDAQDITSRGGANLYPDDPGATYDADVYFDDEVPEIPVQRRREPDFDRNALGEGRALVPRGTPDERLRAPANGDVNAPDLPLVITGTGVPMGDPFIHRRARPLTMRIGIAALMACILVTGLFSVTPLGTKADGGLTPFEVLSGALVVHQGENYQWYTAKWGDQFETVAAKFHVQIGGLFELNNLPVGAEMTVGKLYKIPDDPFYGANFRPSEAALAGATSGSDWWNSFAGEPGAEVPCAPDGGSNPLGYDFHSPNWGAGWIRGFSWYHNGVDTAAPDGNPIHAVQYGEVVWAGWTNTGFGFSIRINHCHGVATLYGHLSKILVHVGQVVKPGDVIGLEGSTGWSTGAHLHMSVLLGQQTFVDPMAYYGYSVYKYTHGG